MNQRIRDRHSPERIRRLSRILAACCLIFITLLPIAVMVYWLLADTADLAANANLAPTAIQENFSMWQRILAGLLSEIPLLMFVAGLWQVRRCFMQFSIGRFFSTTVVLGFSRFAGWTMASVIASVVTASLVSVVITIQNPAGSRMFTLSFGSDQVLLLFFAGMVWVMASIVHQGQMLAQENASFV